MTLISPTPKALVSQVPVRTGKASREYVAQLFFNGSADDDWNDANTTGAAATRTFLTHPNVVSAKYDGAVANNGLQSMRIQPAALGQTTMGVRQNFASPLDLSSADAWWALRYMFEGAFLAKVQRMRLYFYSTANATPAIRTGFYEANQSASWGRFITPSTHLEGRKTNVSGGHAMTAVTGIEVYVAAKAGQNLDGISLVLDWLGLYINNYPRGVLMLRTDDNRVAHSNVAALLDRYQIPTTYAVIARELGGGGELPSLDYYMRIRESRSNHAFTNHLNGNYPGGSQWKGETSPVDLSAFGTNEARRAAIDDCAEWMVRNGLADQHRVVVVPGGGDKPGTDDWELLKDNTAQALWYAGAGDPGSQIGLGHASSLAYPGFDGRVIPASFLVGNTTNFTTGLSNAIARKGLFSVYNHSDEITLAQYDAMFAGIRAAVDAGTLEVITIRDYLATAGGG